MYSCQMSSTFLVVAVVALGVFCPLAELDVDFLDHPTESDETLAEEQRELAELFLREAAAMGKPLLH